MNAIAAVSAAWGIGREGDLLFRISGDLKRFRALTSGGTVIMGRKTLDSLPGGRPLPKRRNVVLTRDSAFAREGVTYAPLVPLLDALGGWETTWDPSSRTASAETALFDLDVPVGRSHVLADGFPFSLSAGTLVWGGRTYVPLRSVANLLGAEVEFVDWDNSVTVCDGVEQSWTEEDLHWLSRIISAESRGEPMEGQIAVGNVVLEWVESPDFPDTIPDVVFQQADGIVQFEPVENGTVYLDPTEQSVEAARRTLSGEKSLEGAMFFYAPALSEGVWINGNRTDLTTIGCHRFYL